MNMIQRAITRLLGLPIPLAEEEKVAKREAAVERLRNSLLSQLEGAGMIPPGMELVEVGGEDIPGVGIAKQMMLKPKRPGVKPPDDDEWTWQKWQATMKDLKVDGWSPCRFVNRLGHETMSFVFGLTRGDFGIWQAPMPCCVEALDEADAKSHEHIILTSVTYLPNGIGIALFDSKESAVRAVELAAPILAGVDFERDDHDKAWPALREKLHETWRFHGIVEDEDAHAHTDAMGTTAPIWRLVDTTDEPTPKVLS